MKVTVADGTIARAEACGKCDLLMRDDVTKKPTRHSMRVHYVPGLTQRLFSFRENSYDTPTIKFTTPLDVRTA